MLYKLYKNIFRENPPKERRELFSQLYEKYDVKLIGVFHQKGNHLNKFMLTAYRDEEHYQKFVEAVRELPEYKEMTERIDAVRIDSEVIDLVRE